MSEKVIALLDFLDILKNENCDTLVEVLAHLCQQCCPGYEQPEKTMKARRDLRHLLMRCLEDLWAHLVGPLDDFEAFYDSVIVDRGGDEHQIVNIRGKHYRDDMKIGQDGDEDVAYHLERRAETQSGTITMPTEDVAQDVHCETDAVEQRIRDARKGRADIQMLPTQSAFCQNANVGEGQITGCSITGEIGQTHRAASCEVSQDLHSSKSQT